MVCYTKGILRALDTRHGMDLVSRTRHVVVGFRGPNVLRNTFRAVASNLCVYDVLGHRGEILSIRIMPLSALREDAFLCPRRADDQSRDRFASRATILTV